MRVSDFALVSFVAGSLLAGCSSPAGEPAPSDGGLAPPAVGQGLQYKMVSTLVPAQETERCQMFQIAEGIAFNRSEIRYSAGSHHVLLFETSYKQFPTMDRTGKTVDPTKVHDCAEGAAGLWDVTRVVGGSQNADGANAIDALPAGVAIKLKPGSIVLMNTHYLNASTQTITTDARVNLYAVPPESVKVEAGMLFFYNPFIHIAPQATNSAHMRCKLSADINLINVQSHMHRRGMNYVANLIDAKGASTELYSNSLWENVPIKRFGAGMALKAGESLDYRCDYKNGENREVIQGFTTKDEMCMLVGPYYPRNDHLEVCETAEGDLDGAATWIGTGNVDCGQTFKCLSNAADAPKEDQARQFYGCVVRSCPASASQISEVLHCQISNAHGACDGCKGSACQKCILDKCKKEINACGAATCG